MPGFSILTSCIQMCVCVWKVMTRPKQALTISRALRKVFEVPTDRTAWSDGRLRRTAKSDGLVGRLSRKAKSDGLVGRLYPKKIKN
ncbi:hypothetical protein BpHYR1_041702 [Brachionus plicatilis]|uniref:Uncharacterized protein n=1 Tax=Brachionus plicatilis TaxID=10195 RepID=A0A3M7Q6W7_BRAPC|nr:hypothetical protein BpHYR1_041702 [Brachionus plicatilis]